MEKLTVIKKFLDKELNIKKIQDSSRNGLQVKGRSNIQKIGFAVDASLSTFNLAKKAKVDLLVVHHGIKWKDAKRTELIKQIENSFKKSNISLYAVHLPLDAHKKHGNNIGLCSILNLIDIKKFGVYHGFKLGYKGNLDKTSTMQNIANILNRKLKTKCHIYSFGKTKIKSIGIVSGGGASAIEDAVLEKLDCFITGEINLSAFNKARDQKLNMIVAGHYATETVGICALKELIGKRFKVKTEFIDNRVEL